MSKINCREDNVCMLCKYWLGKRPEVNYITGYVKRHVEPGLCVKDKSDCKHNSDSLCHKFEKAITYL